MGQTIGSSLNNVGEQWNDRATIVGDDALGLLTLLYFLCNLVVLFCLKSCSKSLNFCLLPLAVSQKGLVLSALSFT